MAGCLQKPQMIPFHKQFPGTGNRLHWNRYSVFLPGLYQHSHRYSVCDRDPILLFQRWLFSKQVHVDFPGIRFLEEVKGLLA